ncbi:MAG: hypothetical protein CR959_00330 [Fusobacteriales bacterium]|nr:MAG: hypothetical protein CR959_00330 [Fusobacteriales bacterium]
MIKKKNDKTLIEYRDRLTAGEKERYRHAQAPKLKMGANGEMTFDIDNTFENSPNFYLLSRVIEKIVQDGEDITPKDKTVSSLLEVMDNKLYEDELLKEVVTDVLEKNGFLEQKKNLEIKEKTLTE